MAYNHCSILALLFIFNILLSSAGPALAGRNIQANADKKQPESFIKHDGSVLIPGFGRVLVPKVHKGHNPLTHNPIIGTGGGRAGISSPSGGGTGGSGGGASRSYIPGGDDTFIPNPGVEVPIPGRGGSIPSSGRP